VILLAGLMMIVALVRTGSLLFYSVQPAPDKPAPALNKMAFAAIIMLLVTSPLMVILAKPLTGFTNDIAAQQNDQRSYIDAILSTQPLTEVSK
ncbi:MAG: monovalent cation/H+ antiporter subunit D, partial [Methylophaga sp.]|nr:monovalent cation/H+ antiporter subunit D [Methylophaga sp.]